MAQMIDRLSQLASAAGAVAEVTRSTTVSRFTPAPGAHLYLHVARAELIFSRHDSDEIVITAIVQPPLSWQIAAEQDETGVYYVALRKPVIGAIGSGRFEALVPRATPVILKLDEVRFIQEGISTTLDLPGAAPIVVR